MSGELMFMNKHFTERPFVSDGLVTNFNDKCCENRQFAIRILFEVFSMTKYFPGLGYMINHGTSESAYWEN